MGPGEIATIVAAVAMLGLHFFRGPNRQYDDLAARIDRAEARIAELSKEQNALALRLAGEHYTRAEIRDMLKDMRETVDSLKGLIDRLSEAQHNKEHPRRG